MAEPRPCEGIRAFGVCHVCTIGTPVADMLAHSPPLIIDYITEDDDITALDDSEDGIVGTRAHEARGSMPTRRFAICNTFTIVIGFLSTCLVLFPFPPLSLCHV